jgi:hypothetical protein
MKKNCWEVKVCGREDGGSKVAELGVCPAAVETRCDGVNHGKNGGRACWALAGTLCGGEVQGAFAHKLANCLSCDFYKQVGREESLNFVSSKQILKLIT